MNKRIAVVFIVIILAAFSYFKLFSEETYAEVYRTIGPNSEITESGIYNLPEPGRLEGWPITVTSIDRKREFEATDGTIIKRKYFRVPAGQYRIELTPWMKEKIVKYIPESSSMFEQEDNNDFDTANIIQPDILYMGSVESSNPTDDYYKLVLPQNGSLSIEGKANYANFSGVYFIGYVYTEDQDGNVKAVQRFGQNISEIRASSENDKVHDGSFNSGKIRVNKGTVYIKISKEHHWIYRGDYQFKVNYIPENEQEYEVEYNDTKETANILNPNTYIIGNISGRSDYDSFYHESYDEIEIDSDYDFYKITLPESGKVRLILNAPKKTLDLFEAELLQYGSNNKPTVIDKLDYKEYPSSYGNEKVLEAGDYYIKITGYGYKKSSFLDYSIQLEYVKGFFSSKKNESVNLKSLTVTENDGENKEIFKFASKEKEMGITLGRDLGVINIFHNTVSKKVEFKINGKKVKGIKVKVGRGKTKKIKIKVYSLKWRNDIYTNR